MRRDPRQFDIPAARWTLARILQVCDWLRLRSLPGLSRLLDRLAISYKRGREHIHSPDPDYLDKLAHAALLIEAGRLGEGRIVTLLLDELTFYRQPTLARAYEERGRHQVFAERSCRKDTPSRVIATLDVRDGRVLYQRRSKITLEQQVAFYQAIRAAYPEARRINVILDNWPDHFHPDVLVALEPQESRWPCYRPANWRTTPRREAQRRWGGLRLPIQLMPLPTYASWTNFIEKLWRWLRQEVLHLHRLADQLEELRAEVDHFLDRFADGSEELLRYVGRSVPD